MWKTEISRGGRPQHRLVSKPGLVLSEQLAERCSRGGVSRQELEPRDMPSRPGKKQSGLLKWALECDGLPRWSIEVGRCPELIGEIP